MNDPLLREAIAMGGHLGDDVARVILARDQAPVEHTPEDVRRINQLARELQDEAGDGELELG